MKNPKPTPPGAQNEPDTPDKKLDTLAEKLRQKYLDIQEEPIPERMQKLIDALKDAERQAKEDG